MFSMIMSIHDIKLKVICWSVGPSKSVGPSQLNVFLYNSYTMSRVETKIGVRVDFNDDLQGQGHGVKGQGQIDDFIENTVLHINRALLVRETPK